MTNKFFEGETVLITLTVGKKDREHPTTVLQVAGHNMTVLTPTDMDDITDNEVRIRRQSFDTVSPAVEGLILKESLPGVLRIFCTDLGRPGNERRGLLRVDDENRIEFGLVSRSEHDRLAEIPGKAWDGQMNKRRGILNDVSGSGLCFRTDQPLKAGDLLRFLLFLGDHAPKFILGFAEVNRAQALVAGDGDSPWEAGIRFTSVTESDQNALVSHVLKKQRVYFPS